MTDTESGTRPVPRDPVGFIQSCVRRRRVYWTYHVNMRLAGRDVRREAILDAVDLYELVEAYPDDKYLPSFLLVTGSPSEAIHVLFGVDVAGDNVRVVTAYRPSPDEWDDDLKTRRASR